ncbi:MAG: helix-turn-helix domain-containing protein [Coriobacteriales bacterium]|jgi:transcriptional regulator with XRE-family HTH domain|nr:helix-turn-helix domain-containing protein [Coriobacteriales bacterium]
MNSKAQEWEGFLGKQLQSLRLRMNLSQAELANRAGVSTVTISRLEGGKGSSLASFIKALQVLRQEDWFNQLAPQASISPIQVHAHGKPRKRARAKNHAPQNNALNNRDLHAL